MPTRSAAARHIAPTFVVVLVAGVLVVGALVAPAYAHRSGSDDDDPRAVALLYRAMDATDRLTYAGTQYVSAWSVLDRSYSTSAIVRVQHAGGTTTLFPDHGTQAVTLPAQPGSWLAGEDGPIGLLAKAYDVELLGRGQVAGRPAEIVGARRSDGSMAARLWLDADYALALRREVYDKSGRTISASAFIEIEVGPGQSRFVGVSPNAWASRAGLVASAARLSHADLAALRSSGWRCPSEIGGDLVLFEASRHDGAIQLSYSDGVATVSVFEQPGQLDPEVLDGFGRTERGDGVVYTLPGPPSRFVWATGEDKVITVIADGSLEAVDSVLAEYPPSEPSSANSVVHRISRGAKKLVSWLNPFD